jgi:hypothetical protein
MGRTRKYPKAQVRMLKFHLERGTK